jgi:cysteine desulfurase
MATLTYLDYNATTPLTPSVHTAVMAALVRFGNPSSVHRAGRDARAMVEDTRETLATVVGCAPSQVIFTSGGTEANVLALRGIAAARGIFTLIGSTIEHPSIFALLAPQNCVPVDRNGVIDLAALDRMLAERPKPALVALMAANNETGVIQPVAEAVAIARRHGALVHCDAVQALGKVPVDFPALGVDSLSISAHKIGGLKGAGALILAAGIEPAADFVGGGQERRRRGGTENTVGVAAFGAALRDVPGRLAAAPRITALRDDLEARLRRAVPEIEIHGAAASRLGNTSCLGLAGLASNTQVIALDLAGIAVSAGAACSSGKVAASHVLLEMGVAEASAGCAIRVSLGPDTTAEDAARFEAAWLRLVDQRRPAIALAVAASA